MAPHPDRVFLGHPHRIAVTWITVRPGRESYQDDVPGVPGVI